MILHIHQLSWTSTQRFSIWLNPDRDKRGEANGAHPYIFSDSNSESLVNAFLCIEMESSSFKKVAVSL